MEKFKKLVEELLGNSKEVIKEDSSKWYITRINDIFKDEGLDEVGTAIAHWVHSNYSSEAMLKKFLDVIGKDKAKELVSKIKSEDIDDVKGSVINSEFADKYLAMLVDDASKELVKLFKEAGNDDHQHDHAKDVASIKEFVHELCNVPDGLISAKDFKKYVFGDKIIRLIG